MLESLVKGDLDSWWMDLYLVMSLSLKYTVHYIHDFVSGNVGLWSSMFLLLYIMWYDILFYRWSVI